MTRIEFFSPGASPGGPLRSTRQLLLAPCLCLCSSCQSYSQGGSLPTGHESNSLLPSPSLATGLSSGRLSWPWLAQFVFWTAFAFPRVLTQWGAYSSGKNQLLPAFEAPSSGMTDCSASMRHFLPSGFVALLKLCLLHRCLQLLLFGCLFLIFAWLFVY